MVLAPGPQEGGQLCSTVDFLASYPRQYYGRHGTTELLGRLLRSNEEDKAAAAERQQELIAQLVAARAPDAVAARAEKISKLGAALRKSVKIKEFKEGGECSIKEWLRRWEHEVESLKKMCGINDALTRDEGIEIFRKHLKLISLFGYSRNNYN